MFSHYPILFWSYSPIYHTLLLIIALYWIFKNLASIFWKGYLEKPLQGHQTRSRSKSQEARANRSSFVIICPFLFFLSTFTAKSLGVCRSTLPAILHMFSLMQLLFHNYIVYSLRWYDTIDCPNTQKVIILYYLLKILAIVSFMSNVGWLKLCLCRFPKSKNNVVIGWKSSGYI